MLRKSFIWLTIPMATSVVLMTSGLPAQARALPDRDVPCSERGGLERARCERQRHLQAVCGAVPGAARAHCERCFIAANTIPCERYDRDDRRRCEAEPEALPACSDGPVEAFMPCLNEALSSASVRLAAQR